jgi:hypothetical protein
MQADLPREMRNTTHPGNVRSWNKEMRDTLERLSRLANVKPEDAFREIHRLITEQTNADEDDLTPAHVTLAEIEHVVQSLGKRNGKRKSDDTNNERSSSPFKRFKQCVSHRVGLRVYDPGSIPSSLTYRLVRTGLSAHNASRRRYRS